MLNVKKPIAKVLQGGVALKYDFSVATGIRTRWSGESLGIFVPPVAFGTPVTATVARGAGSQRVVLTCFADGLGHHKVGHVSGLSTPRFCASLTPRTFFARRLAAVLGLVTFLALRQSVLGSLEVEENKLLNGIFGLFWEQETLVFSNDPRFAALAQPLAALVQLDGLL